MVEKSVKIVLLGVAERAEISSLKVAKLSCFFVSNLIALSIFNNR